MEHLTVTLGWQAEVARMVGVTQFFDPDGAAWMCEPRVETLPRPPTYDAVSARGHLSMKVKRRDWALPLIEGAVYGVGVPGHAQWHVDWTSTRIAWHVVRGGALMSVARDEAYDAIDPVHAAARAEARRRESVAKEARLSSRTTKIEVAGLGTQNLPRAGWVVCTAIWAREALIRPATADEIAVAEAREIAEAVAVASI